ncbi:hypothetical protein DL89DRAFT_129396 [Linderina pennispora]|uniref:Uncharacterized protein n=1 Tax=Linderina pennispora TaxID=61395 RepID=A0A1Y1WE44_9FUNG|nr:uncharacterized protein DL89DRAFT_129396 [Linderina pennispora]ORX71598.1 hypothetical protein DL89DRAFT_129396 [Linderina pennispora]
MDLGALTCCFGTTDAAWRLRVLLSIRLLRSLAKLLFIMLSSPPPALPPLFLGSFFASVALPPVSVPELPIALDFGQPGVHRRLLAPYCGRICRCQLHNPDLVITIRRRLLCLLWCR